MPILIRLKLKYRTPGRTLHRAGIDPPGGTGVFSGGRFKAKSSNSGTGQKGVGQTLRPRMKAYGPW